MLLPQNPGVDKGRKNPRNMLGVALIGDDKEQYTITCTSKIHKGKFLRYQFDLCLQKWLSQNDVNTHATLSSWEVVSESAFSNQEFLNAIVLDTRNVRQIMLNVLKII